MKITEYLNKDYRYYNNEQRLSLLQSILNDYKNEYAGKSIYSLININTEATLSKIQQFFTVINKIINAIKQDQNKLSKEQKNLLAKYSKQIHDHEIDLRKVIERNMKNNQGIIKSCKSAIDNKYN